MAGSKVGVDGSGVEVVDGDCGGGDGVEGLAGEHVDEHGVAE